MVDWRNLGAGITAALCIGIGGLLSPALVNSSDDTRLHEALRVLVHSQAGRSLLEHAMDAWKLEDDASLYRMFRWSSTSRTDAVLTRHFNPSTGAEHRERKITIYLKKDQPLSELVLDVAHELTHATSKPAWDPYDPTLTAGSYIWAAIEGKGGEIDALITECEVGLELSHDYGLQAARCKRYLKSESSPRDLERDKVLKDFYRVGKWQTEIHTRLGTEIAKFPHLSNEKPQLYSSTGHAPYPVALLKEYEEITQVACDNSRKRAKSFTADPFNLGRAPASLSTYKENLSRFLTARCSKN